MVHSIVSGIYSWQGDQITACLWLVGAVLQFSELVERWKCV